MCIQSKNIQLWAKLFIINGLNGLNKMTGVSKCHLRSIRDNPDFIPSPLIQRKLSSSLNIPIDEMFPFLSEEDEAA